MRKFFRYWLPVVAWAAFITLLSTSDFGEPASQRWLSELLRYFSPDVHGNTIRLANLTVRKLSHLGEYFVLSVLLLRALRADAPVAWQWRWGALTLTLALGFAVLDEVHQAFEPSRQSSAIDVGIDVAGAALAQLFLYWRVAPHKKTNSATASRESPEET